MRLPQVRRRRVFAIAPTADYCRFMLNFLRTRQREPEWMDEPDADPAELARSLEYIRKVNRRMGYTQVILDHLARFSACWKRGQAIRIVDVATGSADIPLAILTWAQKQGWDVHVVGVDLSASTIGHAALVAQHPRLTLVQGNALDLPFGDGNFDYAITSMFLHHLSDADAERALAEMGRVASRGVIASDLLRMRRSYAAIWLATMFAGPMVRHDARVSIRQSFSGAEIRAIANRAGLGYADYFVHLHHRFALAGEKQPLEHFDFGVPCCSGRHGHATANFRNWVYRSIVAIRSLGPNRCHLSTPGHSGAGRSSTFRNAPSPRRPGLGARRRNR